MKKLKDPREEALMEMMASGTLSVTRVSHWLFLRWTTCDIGHIPLSLLKEFKRVEEQIKQDKTLRGWICDSEITHVEMHKLLQRVGARKYAVSGNAISFMKEIDHV